VIEGGRGQRWTGGGWWCGEATGAPPRLRVTSRAGAGGVAKVEGGRGGGGRR
jgi:hypothetical protein